MNSVLTVMLLASLASSENGTDEIAQRRHLGSAGFSDSEIASRLNLSRIEADKTKGLLPRTITAAPEVPVTQGYLDSVEQRQAQAVYVKFNADKGTSLIERG